MESIYLRRHKFSMTVRQKESQNLKTFLLTNVIFLIQFPNATVFLTLKFERTCSLQRTLRNPRRPWRIRTRLCRKKANGKHCSRVMYDLNLFKFVRLACIRLPA